MSKLLIPNTCQVPNVIFDEVMRRISDPALRVLLAIVRKTYGFQKHSDTVSLTQLQKITGLSRQGVVNGIRALGSLLKINKRGGLEGNEYSLNLNVKTGELVNAVDQSMGLISQRDVKTTSQRRRHTKPNKNKTQESTESEKLIPDSLSTKEKRKRTRPAPDPRVEPFLTWFAEEYQKRHDAPYAVNWGKDGRLIRELPPAFDLPRLKALALRFFESQDPWVRQNGGFTVGVFISQINKLTSTGSNSHAKPVRSKRPR